MSEVTPTNIVEQLVRDEGKRLRLYKDKYGYNTIGTGRNLDAEGISDDENDLMLANDVKKVTEQLTEHLPWFSKLDDARKGVLLNMAFNLGAIGLLGFHTTLHLIEIGDYGQAATQMLRSRWAIQVPERAQRLAEQMRSGQWQ